jgi:hypothetical protein
MTPLRVFPWLYLGVQPLESKGIAVPVVFTPRIAVTAPPRTRSLVTGFSTSRFRGRPRRSDPNCSHLFTNRTGRAEPRLRMRDSIPEKWLAALDDLRNWLIREAA